MRSGTAPHGCIVPTHRGSGPKAKSSIRPSRKVVAHETFQKTTYNGTAAEPGDRNAFTGTGRVESQPG